MARIINQNNEVIATKNNDGAKKATVSKTLFIVGLALAIALIAVIIVVILFVTTKEKNEKEKTKTPLLQYIDNYNGTVKNNPKIKLLSGNDISYTIERFSGECYILVYDVDWMTKNEVDSDLYKAYDRLDSYLTGKSKIDGTQTVGEPLLKSLENCGQDIKFFVVDINSVAKKEEDAQKNPEYFKSHNGVSFQNLKAPMFFHYVDSEKYDDMNDEDLLIGDGNTKAGQWKAIINYEVNYLNSLTNNSQD
ncbi:MAG: hypothetical protein K6E24_04930 [bacterium]|nr:hypothetical protein [bacterium]